MGFRMGFLTGLGAGYYLGARAGRQRYEQINRAVAKARRSPVVESATEKAAERARAVVGRDHAGGGGGDGTVGARATETALPVPAPQVTPEVPAATTVVDPADPGDYSSSR